MKKVLIIASIVAVILVGFRFVTTKIGESSRAKQLALGAVPEVQLDTIKEIEMAKSIEVPGRVESTDKVELVARVDGYLQKKHFQEGDYVKKGQILLTIEPTQYLNNVNKAKADLENAKAALYKAERDYDRGDELVKKDYISKSAYDALYADKMAKTAVVKAARAALAEAQRNYGYTSIESPIDGKIGSLNIQEGNYVTVQSGALATVVKTNPIYVKYSIDSKQINELRKMDFMENDKKSPIQVDVVLSNGKTYATKGVQDFFDNQISSTTGTMDFRATFENEENVLIPGDFVKVKVYSNQNNSILVVPQEFALQDSKGRYVLVADENNMVQPKYFKDKGQYDKYWIINSGLEKDEKIIITNLNRLMPKQKVKIAQQQNDEVKK